MIKSRERNTHLAKSREKMTPSNQSPDGRAQLFSHRLSYPCGPAEGEGCEPGVCPSSQGFSFGRNL